MDRPPPPPPHPHPHRPPPSSSSSSSSSSSPSSSSSASPPTFAYDRHLHPPSPSLSSRRRPEIAQQHQPTATRPKPLTSQTPSPQLAISFLLNPVPPDGYSDNNGREDGRAVEDRYGAPFDRLVADSDALVTEPRSWPARPSATSLPVWTAAAELHRPHTSTSTTTTTSPSSSSPAGYSSSRSSSSSSSSSSMSPSAAASMAPPASTIATLFEPLLELQRREEHLNLQREKYLILETQRLELRKQLAQFQVRLVGGQDLAPVANSQQQQRQRQQRKRARPADDGVQREEGPAAAAATATATSSIKRPKNDHEDDRDTYRPAGGRRR